MKIIKNPVEVKVGDGKILKATKIGQVVHYFIENHELKLNTVKNVFFVEKMAKNLISLGKVAVANKIVSQDNTFKIYTKHNN